MEKILIYRAIKTPDGTILPTLHRHDYKEYTDKTNGEWYMIDGGLDTHYRTSANITADDIIEIYNTDDIELIREYVVRGIYTMSGKPITPLMKHLSNRHIENIIVYNNSIALDHNVLRILSDETKLSDKVKVHNDILNRELEYRKKHNIFINDTYVEQ